MAVCVKYKKGPPTPHVQGALSLKCHQYMFTWTTGEKKVCYLKEADPKIFFVCMFNYFFFIFKRGKLFAFNFQLSVDVERNYLFFARMWVFFNFKKYDLLKSYFIRTQYICFRLFFVCCIITLIKPWKELIYLRPNN